VAAGADARPAPAENIPTSVKALELAAIVPLLGWFAVVAVRDPGTFSDPGLIEWIAAIALVDLLPVPTTVGLPFSLSFPLQLSVALIYPNPVISGLVVFFGSTDWRELRRGQAEARSGIVRRWPGRSWRGDPLPRARLAQSQWYV
jgi:hypothetical protein